MDRSLLSLALRGEDLCSRRSSPDRSRSDDDRDDHGDGEGRQRHAWKEGPDAERDDRHDREDQLDRGRRLGDHGDDRDREREDGNQPPKLIGLEPSLAGPVGHPSTVVRVSRPLHPLTERPEDSDPGWTCEAMLIWSLRLGP